MELHFIITVSAVVEGWTASGSHELCSLASACLKIYNMFITSSLSWYHKQVNNCYSKDNNKPKYLSTKYGGKWAVIAVQCACNTAIQVPWKYTVYLNCRKLSPPSFSWNCREVLKWVAQSWILSLLSLYHHLCIIVLCDCQCAKWPHMKGIVFFQYAHMFSASLLQIDHYLL